MSGALGWSDDGRGAGWDCPCVEMWVRFEVQVRADLREVAFGGGGGALSEEGGSSGG